MRLPRPCSSRAVEKLGIEVVLEAQTAAIEGDGRAERVVLKDGRALPASLVVMAAGVRPETGLAQGAGIEVGRGILVDDKLETNWPSVYAIGECAEHRGVCYGLVEPAYAQAKALARHLAGLPARYEGSLLATNLKVSGVPVFSMGDFEGEGAETIVLEDQAAATYRKLVVRDSRLAGAVLVGDTTDALWYRELMSRGRPSRRSETGSPSGAHWPSARPLECAGRQDAHAQILAALPQRTADEPDASVGIRRKLVDSRLQRSATWHDA